MAEKENQLSRYGAIAKAYPNTFGKVFFLLNSSDSWLPRIQESFPPDASGRDRVYTSWTAVVAAVIAGRGDTIVVSTSFTTPPTSGQLVTLEAAGVNIQYSGVSIDAEGVYVSYRATATLPQGVAGNIFTVVGKVILYDIIGEVTTAVQNQANATKLQGITTTPSSTVDLCATTSIANAAVGTQFSITGTFATALVVSTGSFVRQAASTILLPGTVALNCAASNTGSVKWLARWKPIEPGATLLAV